MGNKRRKFIVNTKLPSLNEYIKQINNNRHQGNKFKQEIEELICWYIKLAKIDKVEKTCFVKFIWHEKTRKRDCDNIASAKKFILDALQKCEIIKNDNQKYITGFSDVFIKDDKDFVEVELIEYENVQGEEK